MPHYPKNTIGNLTLPMIKENKKMRINVTFLIFFGHVDEKWAFLIFFGHVDGRPATDKGVTTRHLRWKPN